MSNRYLLLSLLLAWLGGFSWLPAQAADSFIALSYHDVEDVVPKEEALGRTVVSLDHLKAHFAWLKQNGYRVVSVQDLLDAKSGRKKLPEKAVLLCFDDGYASFYSKVFPLLKQYHYPALIALVTSWLNVPEGGKVRYDEKEPWSRDEFLTWAQIRELARSGLVEVASHSHDSHHGILGNPQGNSQPALVTRQYNSETRSYESDAAYEQRIQAEIRQNVDELQQHAGIKPRVIVWPYGEYNQPLIEMARSAGIPISMGLADGRNSVTDLSAIKRLLVAEDPNSDDFAKIITTLRADRPLRVVHLDLDYIHDPDPVQTERNLDALLNRIRSMHANTVFLQAYADPDGDGNADALYFPNRHLPLRADLFSRVAWQLKTRVRVRVYAWMPVLAFRIDAPEAWFVHEWRDDQARLSNHIYRRLSPFNADARRVIGEIYEDLAKYANFDGLLFHDDALLTDYEDVSPAGLADLGKTRDLPQNFSSLHASPEARMRWAQHKTAILNGFTRSLAERVRRYRPDIKTARNLYAWPLLKPYSEEWYAQSFATALADYDYVALEAMPTMEEAENPDAWLTELVLKAALHPEGLRKTVFELQSVDWKSQSDIPMEQFLKQIKRIQELGAVHYGHYPDNVFRDQPRLKELETVYALPQSP
jgi:biofilm PGA synthesis lipoprotein PgaB